VGTLEVTVQKGKDHCIQKKSWKIEPSIIVYIDVYKTMGKEAKC